MFQHLFATMNEMLDEIILHYPQAQDVSKQEMNQKLALLRALSDGIIEEWLLFEEKMGAFRAKGAGQKEWLESSAETRSEAFMRGQGYYRLFMFRQAIDAFETVVRQFPDGIVSRIYLAMAYLQLGESNDAYRHFQLIIPLTDNKKVKAISYNALGCIQAQRKNFEKAQEYFKLAHQTDPQLQEPLANLKVCQYNDGTLQYGSELTSFM